MFAQAYDNPIPGFETKTVGNLRLFEAVPETELNLEDFNKGDFAKVPPLTARSVWSQSLTAELHCRHDQHCIQPPMAACLALDAQVVARRACTCCQNLKPFRD